ncbi:MAG: hypothetical protein B7Z80_18665, partial [Rhodospirillales bacterium 20-64-7]
MHLIETLGQIGWPERRHLMRVALFGLVGTGAACTSPNCDPNQAGFLTGIGNAASGCYAQTNAAYQQQLETSAAIRDQERAHAAAAAANSAAAQ